MSSIRKRALDYLNNNLSPRQHIPLEKAENPGGIAGIGGSRAIKQENAKRAERNARRAPNNAKVELREKRMDGRQANNAEQYLADRRIDIENAAPTALVAGLGTLGLAVIGGVAQAYTQQANEQRPTDPLAVFGRAVGNAGTGIGMDPLAQARDSARQASINAGSYNVMSAVMQDELNNMEALDSAAKASLVSGPSSAYQVSIAQMVNQRADELMAQPYEMADGTLRTMPYPTAVARAQEEVNLQLRADGVI